MDRKDEIIQLQNEVMQGLLRQRMQLLSEDLWGLTPESLLGRTSGAPAAPKAPQNPPAAPKVPAPQDKQAAQEKPEQAKKEP